MPSPVFLAWEQKLAAEISAKKGFWAGFVFMATYLESEGLATKCARKPQQTHCDACLDSVRPL